MTTKIKLNIKRKYKTRARQKLKVTDIVKIWTTNVWLVKKIYVCAQELVCKQHIAYAGWQEVYWNTT